MYRVGTQLYDIPVSGRSCTTYPCRDAVVRHTRVWTQLYNIPVSGRSCTAYPCRDAVVRHTRVGTQLYDIPVSGRSCTAYPCRDAVVRRTYVVVIHHRKTDTHNVERNLQTDYQENNKHIIRVIGRFLNCSIDK